MKKLCTLLLALCMGGIACAQGFPSKPIRLVIGFPAGGPLDQHARLLSDKLQGILGQPIVIDYKAGAGGTVGAQDVMKAPADGHTQVLALPEIRSRMTTQGADPAFLGSQDFAAFLTAELPRWHAVVQQSGAKLD